MSNRAKWAVFIAVFLWASAYAAIRAGLEGFSPEGLALLRYCIASVCMAIIYFMSPTRSTMRMRDRIALLCIGGFGIGLYNVLLNYGEISVSSGMASFIISQSPLMTAIIAILFFGERINFLGVIGFAISVLGIACISSGNNTGFTWDMSIAYILLATVVGGMYSLLQKPFLKRYHSIETAAYAIWGATLFLSIFWRHLSHDLHYASLNSTLVVIYLGLFPAAMGYVCWGYVLTEISAARAVSFLYFTPFIATLLGWLWLNEVPVWLSLFGGLLAISGVWLVNHSYRKKAA